MSRRKHHRKKGEISLACFLMRAGLLDVCLDCGGVYRIHRGRRRRMTAKKHYKGYLWVDLWRKNKSAKGKRRVWRMSAWIHRLAFMKKRAMRNLKLARENGDAADLADWKSFVFDLPETLHVDHLKGGIEDNRGKNLRLRTQSGNSGKGPMSAAESAEVEAELSYYEEF